MSRLDSTMSVLFLLAWVGAASALADPAGELRTITTRELRDRIAGGWAGKMIGVAYGAPTEFKARGVTYDDPIAWEPGQIEDSLEEDDLYVQLAYMMAMDRHGLDAPAHRLADALADAGFRLWHANRKARKNVWDGIPPPLSGHPKYSMHADDIDFQIAADYIGFMNPGMLRSSNAMCDRAGHITNYGDGVYGGMFVSGLYAAAYFESDIPTIIETALRTIPERSGYARCVRDAIAGHAAHPESWRRTWQALQDKWGRTDVCGAMDPFNIDAKLNGAYIALALLHGEGDIERTLEIAVRSGQDSDCNPSNALGVLGLRLGYEAIPEVWKGGLPEIADTPFLFTSYSFNTLVDSTLRYARQLIVRNGGRIEGEVCRIRLQEPVPAPFEQSFPHLKAAYRTTTADAGWAWTGRWDTRPDEAGEPIQRVADEKGAEVSFTFRGTGALIMGNWGRDGGKADVYLDGHLVRTIDNYYWVDGRGANSTWLNGAHLFHALGLAPGEHTIRMVLTGDRNEKATGSKMWVERAIVFERE